MILTNMFVDETQFTHPTLGFESHKDMRLIVFDSSWSGKFNIAIVFLFFI